MASSGEGGEARWPEGAEAGDGVVDDDPPVEGLPPHLRFSLELRSSQEQAELKRSRTVLKSSGTSHAAALEPDGPFGVVPPARGADVETDLGYYRVEVTVKSDSGYLNCGCMEYINTKGTGDKKGKPHTAEKMFPGLDFRNPGDTIWWRYCNDSTGAFNRKQRLPNNPPDMRGQEVTVALEYTNGEGTFSVQAENDPEPVVFEGLPPGCLLYFGAMGSVEILGGRSSMDAMVKSARKK